MAKEIIVSSTSFEKKVAIVEDDQITQILIERDQNRGILGNVYKGRVTRVLPGMQAAFVDIGLERNAFLYVTDFFEDYEEYADLVKTDGETAAPEAPLSEAAVDADGARRGRRSRRSRRVTRGRTEAEAAAEPLEENAPAAAEEPVAEDDWVALPGEERVILPAAGTPVAGTVSPQPRRERFRESPPTPAAPERRGEPARSDRPPERQLSRPTGAPRRQRVPPPPIGRILPAELPVAATGFAAPGAEGAAGAPAILPDELQPVINEEALPKRSASVLSRSSVNQMATGRNGSRSRKRSAQAGTGPLIANLLKEGQEILVQVAKEPIAKKGARITSHIVFPGRFMVFMPTVNHVGVSRKVESAKERQRLRELVMEFRGDVERGFIVRTAGEGRSREELRQDMLYLTRLWEQVRVKAERASAPALIHSELDLVQRVIRDYFSDDFRSARIDDEEEYARVVEFVSSVNPELTDRIRLHTKRTPIFDEYGVNAEIERSLKSKVWLRSGGHIVINQTEALVAIDVNTGKFVGRTTSLEDTIARTNLDAVREVVRQIRLRDLGGIIIVDFIDMIEARNQQKVLEALQTELRKDKSPSKVLPFNDFGLVAITRKRVRQSLERTLCQPCSCCEGSGTTHSAQTVCYTIHDEIRRTLSSLGDGRELIIRCHPEVGDALRTSENRVVRELKAVTGKQVTIVNDPLMHIEKYDLVEV
jgi:Rne/Rng family ribonuclease